MLHSFPAIYLNSPDFMKKLITCSKCKANPFLLYGESNFLISTMISKFMHHNHNMVQFEQDGYSLVTLLRPDELDMLLEQQIKEESSE